MGSESMCLVWNTYVLCVIWTVSQGLHVLRGCCGKCGHCLFRGCMGREALSTWHQVTSHHPWSTSGVMPVGPDAT